MTPAITPRWLKLKSAEIYCGVTSRTIWRWISNGVVKSRLVKADGANRGIRLVDRESLDAFIDGHGDDPAQLAMNTRSRTIRKPRSTG